MITTYVCPVCGTKVPRESEDFPFCSERCRTIDLGRWADGSYAIPGDKAEPDNDDKDSRIH